MLMRSERGYFSSHSRISSLNNGIPTVIPLIIKLYKFLKLKIVATCPKDGYVFLFLYFLFLQYVWVSCYTFYNKYFLDNLPDKIYVVHV